MKENELRKMILSLTVIISLFVFLILLFEDNQTNIINSIKNTSNEDISVYKSIVIYDVKISFIKLKTIIEITFLGLSGLFVLSMMGKKRE